MQVEIADQTKSFIKNAVNIGRKRQSPVTGFIHYTFEDASLDHTIPLYENIVFALALCRTNQADHILEARDLLLKLFPYFEKPGAFGIYLHEWPEIRKPAANVRFLFPLLHIQREYSHVMGEEARDKLKYMLDHLSSYLDQIDLPPLMSFQKQVFNAVYFQKPMPAIDRELFQSTRDYSELIVIAPFITQLIEWPRLEELDVFAGAYVHELKRTTLYDLYFGQRAREDEITPLHGALIYPFESKSYLPARVNEWQNILDEKTLFTFLTEYEPKEGRISPGHHLFHIKTMQNALVCQASHAKFKAEYEQDELVCDFIVRKDDHIDFFLAYDDKECLKVNGPKATFFELGDKLQIMGLEITFEKISGVGRMCGHFFRGNRPAQKCPKVKSEWAAYDWQISLTMLELISPMHIRAKIKKK